MLTCMLVILEELLESAYDRLRLRRLRMILEGDENEKEKAR